MIKKFKDYIIETIKEEYKFIIILLLIFITLNFPLNYFITTGGGISSATSRIEVENANKAKGSFNISYITQLDANILFYGLSYIIPSWEREDANLYKFDESESLDDIDFRSKLDLKTASSTATYWAYTLAKKSIEETSSNLYVIATGFEGHDTNLKVQDEILSINNETYNSIDEYSNYLQTFGSGEMVDVKIKRNGKEQTISTKLYEENGRKILGVVLQYVREYKTNPKIEINFKESESGPSGGLITTLEIYNQLTKKDITKGKTIAGTGTIEEDGTIGEIGGIEHKILGASKAKADIFLCPGNDNYKDAKKYIKEKNIKIKLIKVETIQEALEKLEELA